MKLRCGLTFNNENLDLKSSVVEQIKLIVLVEVIVGVIVVLKQI